MARQQPEIDGFECARCTKHPTSGHVAQIPERSAAVPGRSNFSPPKSPVMPTANDLIGFCKLNYIPRDKSRAPGFEQHSRQSDHFQSLAPFVGCQLKTSRRNLDPADARMLRGKACLLDSGAGSR